MISLPTSRRAPRLPMLLLLLLGTGPASVAWAADAAPQPVSVKASAHFGFDRTTISEEDRAKILAEVAQMKDVTWQSISTTGYTDAVGSAGYNERLSARRAAAVKRYLVGKGLKPEMIDAQGAGAGQPVATNDTKAGRAQNRRAEIEFKGVRTGSAP